MYAGSFNLNIWLRTFIRSDLVDEYEKECRDIVNKYAGVKSEEILIDEISELNQSLYKLCFEALAKKNLYNEEIKDE